MIYDNFPLRDILSWKLKDNSARLTSKVAKSTADLSFYMMTFVAFVGCGCPKVFQKLTENIDVFLFTLSHICYLLKIQVFKEKIVE